MGQVLVLKRLKASASFLEASYGDTSDFSETMMSVGGSSLPHEGTMWREMPDQVPASPEIQQEAQACEQRRHLLLSSLKQTQGGAEEPHY